MLKGVLFDMGDTLQRYKVEDWNVLREQLNRNLYGYLESRGHAGRLPPLDEFLEMVNTRTNAHWDAGRTTMRMRPITELLGPLFAEVGVDDVQPEECLLPWYSHVTDRLYVETDVKPTLEYLRDSGLSLGLVSNTAWPSGAHDPDLEQFGIKDLLECRFYSCEVGWEKPARQIFEVALGCLGLQPEETAFVGDFLRYDVAGAHGVGMKGIWRRIEGRPESADDHSIVPDAIIDRIGDLPGVLEKLYGWRPANREQTSDM